MSTAERSELLPFRVRLVDGPQDLAKAVDIRSLAYGRHIPRLGSELRVPEAEDYRPDVILLIAERKLDQRAIGTIRLETNVNGPLRIEREANVPASYGGKRLVETCRLGVEHGIRGTMVMAALVKAAFEICHACNVDYALAVGRRSMAEVFRTLCYDALDGPVRNSYSYTVPLWIFGIPIREVETRLAAKRHSYYSFMAQIQHPDITVDYDRVFEAFRPR